MIATANTYFKGRGAQLNTLNRFEKSSYVTDYQEVLDEELLLEQKTEVIFTIPKTIINTVQSPDLGMEYSLNPYQGCEHGCIYCYARNTHEYWGYSAGVDFEQKIIVKQNVIEVLEKQLSNKNWKVKPIVISGNTDCYQPLEKKFEITRKVLQTCLKFKHPVSIITKNALILRDLDVLAELASLNLVHVMISITGTDEKMRNKLEPRTSTYQNRLKIIEGLSKAGIPCGVMIAPIIPGINNHEIPAIIDLAAKSGATSAAYQIVRLNGAVGPIFKDWLTKTFPDRAEKVWNQICDAHGGKVNDSRFGVRMRGEGKMAKSIKQLFDISLNRFMKNRKKFEYNLNDFNYKAANEQLSLF
ncbi:MAG: PA0069 family radical SAM protein [Sphingobacteriaceae bacterium]|nr:PA0069 family radical SAM protein [Sphingobacteriaceae bacterium]